MNFKKVYFSFLFLFIIVRTLTASSITSSYQERVDTTNNITKDFPTIKDSVDSLIKRATILKKDRNYNEVINLYNQAFTIAKQFNDTLKIPLLHYYLGDAFFEIKNYTMAIAEFEACLKYQLILEEPNLFAHASFNLGAIYSEFSNYELSLNYYKDALDTFFKLEKSGAALQTLDSIGGVYITQGDKEEALKYYLQGLDIVDKSTTMNTVAKLSTKVGRIYLEVKNDSLALNYLHKALKQASHINDSSLLNEVYSNTGLAYYNIGEYKRAEIYFNNAKKVSRNINDRKSLAETFKNLAISNEKLNRKSNEIMYFKKYVDLKDSLLNEENQKKIAEIKTEFEVQNKQKTIEILEHQKALLSSQADMKDMAFRNNRILLIFFASVLFLSMLFVALLIKRHNSKRRSNLALQNHLAEVRQQKNQIEIQRDIIEQNNKKLEEARKIITKKNRLLEENNLLLERTINERTLELYKAYQKLSFHVDNTSLAVMEFNDRLELIRWSDQAEVMFGWTAPEVLGKRFHEIGFVLTKDIESAIKSMHDLLYGQDASISFLSLNGNKFGETLHIEWNTSVLLNKDGSVDSIMAIANNVSSRELAFEALQSSHRELDNFIYKASHDLRGPLARIQGVVNLGLMEVKENPAKDYFNMLHVTAHQLNNILSRLLMIYDINHHDLKIEKINLKNAILEILSGLTEENKLLNIDLKLKIERDLIWETDLLLFQIIIKNLFDNAIFFQDKNKIKVLLECRLVFEDKLVIKITDNGLGIPENLREKVFDMFFHGAAKSGGTGLGLYMAKKAIERLGGSIQLISGQPKSTIFEIVLPKFLESNKRNDGNTIKKIPVNV